MSSAVLPPRASSVNVQTATQSGVDARSQTFQRLVEEDAADGNVFPSPAKQSPLLKDISLLRLAASESIHFAGGSPGAESGLHAIALNQLATSFYLNLFGARDGNLSSSPLGLRLSMGGGWSGEAESPELAHARPDHRAGAADGELGVLSARFESGSAGVASVGYDRNGGTSYGTYQISSRQGTMGRFLEFLKAHAPHWSDRLVRSGPANTGNTKGSFPEEWRRIAAEDPESFGKLQHRFIKETHYEPALAEIEVRTGKDLSGCSESMQQVLWSTAVQHGPQGAAGIFEAAVKESDGKTASDEGARGSLDERRVIDRVYALRATKFGSSPAEIQSAVVSRFDRERKLALAMLQGNQRVG